MIFVFRQQSLQQIINTCRDRFIKMFDVYIFVSINFFHQKFVIRFIRIEQNDSILWRDENTEISYMLVHASSKKIVFDVSKSNVSSYRSTSSFSKIFKISKHFNNSFTFFNNVYRNFNKNQICFDNFCKYQYICLKC